MGDEAMKRAGRYVRLFLAFGRFGLNREMAFRGNFIAKVLVEVLWLAILLIFYRIVFAKTSVVADWSEAEYLFFVGCYFSLEGLMETLFLSNCNEFSNLIRSGDLDFYLLKPIDEQFLVTCRDIDWSTVPNVFMGAVVMGLALQQMGWTFDPFQVGTFLVMFACGVAIAYSFMVFLTSSAIWFVRNQSVFELWWLFTSLVRYPKEIYTRSWASPLGFVLTFVVPILLVINVPATIMAKSILDGRMMAFTLVVTVALLIASRRFFQLALRKYRSASS
jgi:ABC-2 type transport system permease protein